MSGKYMKKKKRGGLVALIVLVSAVVAGVLLAALSPWDQTSDVPRTTAAGRSTSAPTETQTPETTLPAQEDPFPIELGQGLAITAIEEYAGIYMEDGSDEAVQGLLMVILENRNEEDLQYAQITLSYADAQAQFDVTNLPSGGRVVLLEKNRMEYRDDLPEAAGLENVALVGEFPMYADIFEITTADGVINVRNISQDDISGDIYIYYKNVGGGLYYGGITYRARIEGGLASGEIRQIMTAHYYEDASEILMVTYAQ